MRRFFLRDWALVVPLHYCHSAHQIVWQKELQTHLLWLQRSEMSLMSGLNKFVWDLGFSSYYPSSFRKSPVSRLSICIRVKPYFTFLHLQPTILFQICRLTLICMEWGKAFSSPWLICGRFIFVFLLHHNAMLLQKKQRKIESNATFVELASKTSPSYPFSPVKLIAVIYCKYVTKR